MKITLHFDTSEIQDRLEYKQMMKAPNMAAVLWDLDQKLRALLKYSDESGAAAQAQTAGLIRAQQLLTELCEAEGINIEDLNN